MPTPNERKGLLFLALVALSGTAVRVWRGRVPPPTSTQVAALDRQLTRVDSVRSAKREAKAKKSRPPKTPILAPVDRQPIDINAATAAEIEALPGVGPALAHRIVVHRDSAGPFAGMTALCDVRGIGPALGERLRPLVTFGGRNSPVSEACDPPSTQAGKAPSGRGQKGP